MTDRKAEHEVEADFRKALKAFLKEWDAELVLEDRSHGYITDHEIAFDLNGQWNDEGMIRPYTNVNIGTYEDGND